MAHILIITAYNPAFTPEFKAWIKKNINPSMISPEPHDKNASYFLDNILSEQLNLSIEDAVLIEELQSQNVEYVEF
jgi:hypothetical protein